MAVLVTLGMTLGVITAMAPASATTDPQITNLTAGDGNCVEEERLLRIKFDYDVIDDIGVHVDGEPIDGFPAEGQGSYDKSFAGFPVGQELAVDIRDGQGQPYEGAATTATLTACETEQPPTESDGMLEWTGNGSENADPGCKAGQSSFWHWILTPGGNNTLVSGTLSVTYESGETTTTEGTFRGGGNGAMHFDVTREGVDVVESAVVSFTYEGEGGNFVLTISDSECKGEPEPPKDKEVTATAPTFVDECETEHDTYTIPSKKGVVYKVNGEVVEAGTYPGTGEVTVTAHAKDGYKLKGDSEWTYTFTDEPCEEEPPVVVEPVVVYNQGSCDVRVPEATVTTTFDSSIGYIVGEDGEPVYQHREVPAGTYKVTLPAVEEGESVTYHVIVSPLDDSAEVYHAEENTFSVPADCGGENPPPVDVCPDLPGNQPEGTDCTPPPHDECPDMEGNQPPGTDCNPPPVVVTPPDVNVDVPPTKVVVVEKEVVEEKFITSRSVKTGGEGLPIVLLGFGLVLIVGLLVAGQRLIGRPVAPRHATR